MTGHSTGPVVDGDGAASDVSRLTLRELKARLEELGVPMNLPGGALSRGEFGRGFVCDKMGAFARRRRHVQPLLGAAFAPFSPASSGSSKHTTRDTCTVYISDAAQSTGGMLAPWHCGRRRRSIVRMAGTNMASALRPPTIPNLRHPSSDDVAAVIRAVEPSDALSSGVLSPCEEESTTDKAAGDTAADARRAQLDSLLSRCDEVDRVIAGAEAAAAEAAASAGNAVARLQATPPRTPTRGPSAAADASVVLGSTGRPGPSSPFRPPRWVDGGGVSVSVCACRDGAPCACTTGQCSCTTSGVACAGVATAGPRATPDAEPVEQAGPDTASPQRHRRAAAAETAVTAPLPGEDLIPAPRGASAPAERTRSPGRARDKSQKTDAWIPPGFDGLDAARTDAAIRREGLLRNETAGTRALWDTVKDERRGRAKDVGLLRSAEGAARRRCHELAALLRAARGREGAADHQARALRAALKAKEERAREAERLRLAAEAALTRAAAAADANQRAAARAEAETRALLESAVGRLEAAGQRARRDAEDRAALASRLDAARAAVAELERERDAALAMVGRLRGAATERDLLEQLARHGALSAAGRDAAVREVNGYPPHRQHRKGHGDCGCSDRRGWRGTVAAAPSAATSSTCGAASSCCTGDAGSSRGGAVRALRRGARDAAAARTAAAEPLAMTPSDRGAHVDWTTMGRDVGDVAAPSSGPSTDADADENNSIAAEGATRRGEELRTLADALLTVAEGRT